MHRRFGFVNDGLDVVGELHVASDLTPRSLTVERSSISVSFTLIGAQSIFFWREKLIVCDFVAFRSMELSLHHVDA